MILIRHAESEWNAAGRFTGWTDSDLTGHGLAQARAAGRLLRDNGFAFDVVFTSRMRRAIRTAWIILEELDTLWTPIEPRWRLNERHFGKLEGMVIEDIHRDYGREWLERWRSDWSLPPPRIEAGDARHPKHDPHYHDVPAAELPSGESMIELKERVTSVFTADIESAIASGKSVLVACHGNTIKVLDELLRQGQGEPIQENPVPAAVPLLYELQPGPLKTRQRRYL